MYVYPSIGPGEWPGRAAHLIKKILIKGAIKCIDTVF